MQWCLPASRQPRPQLAHLALVVCQAALHRLHFLGGPRQLLLRCHQALVGGPRTAQLGLQLLDAGLQEEVGAAVGAAAGAAVGAGS